MCSYETTSKVATQIQWKPSIINWPVAEVKVNSNQPTLPNDRIEYPIAKMVRDVYDQIIQRLKIIMSEGKYDEAVAFGKKNRQVLANFLHADRAYLRTALADFDVYYAQAIIYTGEAEKGIVRLKTVIANVEFGRNPGDVARQGDDPYSSEGQRRNLALGRAHNNLGYAYWMEQGHLTLAIQEFKRALPYFQASKLEEEQANTEDNMGRVYALLKQRDLAETMIDKGLKRRYKLGDDYRIALSLNSRAIV